MRVKIPFTFVNVRKPSARRALVSGTASSAAYLLAQASDRRLSPNRYDDLVLWGGLVARQPRLQRVIGAFTHLSIGVALAAVYDAASPSLPRLPRLLRGILFVQAENTLLFPAVFFMDRLHPAVRRGELPSLWTWRYFWLQALRHAAYGAVLGLTGTVRE